MNAFVLDLDPKLAAAYHCDPHVVKMVTETAQVLSSTHALRNSQPVGAYRPTHLHHPLVRWASERAENYSWLWRLGVALGEEFKLRYGHAHKSALVLLGPLALPPQGMPGVPGAVPERFALVLPPEFDLGDPVASYRAYYRDAKAHLLHRYTNRPLPAWI